MNEERSAIELKLEADRKATTKIAFTPSKRQRELTSRKVLGRPLRKEDLYTGEELRKGRR